MSDHLTEEQLWASLEGGASPGVLSHLEACAACRERRHDAEGGLSLAAGAGPVPEPSPLYWAAFRRQVEQKIGEEPPGSARHSWRRVFTPGALVPVGVAALIVLFLNPVLRQGSAPSGSASPSPALPAWEALPAARDDGSLDVLRGLALAGNDLEAASGCREWTDCLSDEESLDLTAVLEEQMPEGRS
jgi:hypothetical protein